MKARRNVYLEGQKRVNETCSKFNVKEQRVDKDGGTVIAAI
jgi:hypothetical protein